MRKILDIEGKIIFLQSDFLLSTNVFLYKMKKNLRLRLAKRNTDVYRDSYLNFYLITASSIDGG
jgi:hypothetical protein